MNVVEAGQMIRDRLDAYGENFSIQFAPMPQRGLYLTSAPGEPPDWQLSVSVTTATVAFDRPDGRISINHIATTLDILVLDIIRTVQEHLKPVVGPERP